FRHRVSVSKVSTTEDAVDAAVPVGAQNAPTRDLETTKQFPQRQQRSSSVRKRPQPKQKRAASVNPVLGFHIRKSGSCSSAVPDCAALCAATDDGVSGALSVTVTTGSSNGASSAAAASFSASRRTWLYVFIISAET